MTEYEIRRSYENAADPAEQVQILADLNLTSRGEIIRILGGDVKVKKAKYKGFSHIEPFTPEEESEIIRMYNGGYLIKEIAVTLHRSIRGISRKVNQMRKEGIIV